MSRIVYVLTQNIFGAKHPHLCSLMKQHTKMTLLVLALMLPLGMLSAQPKSMWMPNSWAPCEAIVTNFGSSTTDIVATLHKNGVIGVERMGTLADGTLAINFNDPLRRMMVQLTIDSQDHYNGAATWQTVNSIQDARMFVRATAERLMHQGAAIVSGKLGDPAITLEQVCANGKIEITVGLQQGTTTQAMDMPARQQAHGSDLQPAK